MSRSAVLDTSPADGPAAFWNRFDRLCGGARGPLLAALLTLIAALPGLIAVPPLDRDESRFAEATAQMLETGDFINIRYLDQARDKKPVGIHWLQAISVKALSSVEKRRIWAYRVPSILGAMLAAGACAWGAARAFGPRGGVLAGAILGASLILSSEAFIAKTDAVLCGATTLSMVALARLYAASRGEDEGRAKTGVKLLFWIGQAIGILDKGPVAPMVAGLAMLALWAADRRGRWLRSIGWGWGLLLVVAVVGPWSAAITAATDGRFWTGAVGGDLAPKLRGGHEMHGAPPGLHALLAPLLLFPSTFLLPAALVAGWRRRSETAVRFALAWLIPSWIVFELMPTKLVHYTLPTYGALAWLCAAAAVDPAKAAFGIRTRWIGGALSVLVGGALAVLAVIAAQRYGGGGAAGWAAASGALTLAVGLGGALALLSGRMEAGLLACLGLGVLAHMTLTGGLAPRLSTLWTSRNVERALAGAGLDPRDGVTTGPVVLVGYAEPSLVFALGGAELDDAADGAGSVADGQPAVVEKRQDQAFRAALAAQHVAAKPAAEVKGFDYSTGKAMDLVIWRPLAPPPADAKDGAR